MAASYLVNLLIVSYILYTSSIVHLLSGYVIFVENDEGDGIVKCHSAHVTHIKQYIMLLMMMTLSNVTLPCYTYHILYNVVAAVLPFLSSIVIPRDIIYLCNNTLTDRLLLSKIKIYA